MLKVYVAGKISADTPAEMFANIRRGIALTVDIIRLGHAPYPTFTNFLWSLHEEIPNETFYSMDLTWLASADVMVVVPDGHDQSFGVHELEVPLCEELGIPVCMGIEDFKDWLHKYELLHEKKA